MKENLLGKKYGLPDGIDHFDTTAPVCYFAEKLWIHSLIDAVQNPNTIQPRVLSVTDWNHTIETDVPCIQKLDPASENTILVLQGKYSGIICADLKSRRHLRALEENHLFFDDILSQEADAICLRSIREEYYPDESQELLIESYPITKKMIAFIEQLGLAVDKEQWMVNVDEYANQRRSLFESSLNSKKYALSYRRRTGRFKKGVKQFIG